MTKEKLDRIKKAYSSGLKVQIWFNGYWKDFDIRDYSMYAEPFPENRQYRIVGNDYADIAEKHIAELEKACKETQELLDKQIEATYKLHKENTELKKKLKPENCLKLLAKEGYVKLTSEQLIKAKELLLELYDCIPSSMADSCKETLQKVALFFKDSEMEK